MYPQSMFGAKIRKNMNIFVIKFFDFLQLVSVYYIGNFS